MLVAAPHATTWHASHRLLRIATDAPVAFVDITPLVEAAVREAALGEGFVNVQTRHTTTGILVNELEPLLLEPRIGFQVDDIKSLDPRQLPVRYYGWDGFERSVRAEWQPLAQVSLSLQLPFGNNQAKGRFGHAQASLRQSQIREFDVGRRIRDNIVSARGVVRRAAQALARIEEALKFQQTSHEGTLERYRQGDVTLLDTLTTEEVLTQSQIQLAQSWLGYAGALTRLRFEQGALVVFDDIDRPAESLRFDPAGLVAR